MAQPRIMSIAQRKEARGKILDARAAGFSGTAAAKRAGITVGTLWSWLERGKSADSVDIDREYHTFFMEYNSFS